MAKRRPSGDGMVRKRKDGRWEGRIVVGHKENGQPIFRYVHAPTQKELLAKLHQKLDAYDGVELTEDSQMTLSEWLDRWLEEYAAPTVRPSTLDGYRNDIQHYIKPYLGDKQVSQITSIDVQKLYTKLREEGRVHFHPKYGYQLSSAMLTSIHATFHRAMKIAEREHLISKNPTEGVAAPKPNYNPKQILNDEQLDRFMAATRRDEIWRDFFYTELTVGLRCGELCGLKWEDFDEEAGTLKVRRTVHTRRMGVLDVGEPKTGKGKRKIVLPPTTAAVLRERKKTALTEWIFPNPLKPEEPTDPHAAYRRMKAILKQEDLPSIRFHDLRHTFATHALTSGVDAKTLAGILGHTNASFTLDTYTHVTGDMQKQAAGIVGDFMTDILGEEWKPWEESAKMGTFASAAGGGSCEQ